VSEPENFLSRWARLKREAAEEPEHATPDAAADETRADTPAGEAEALPAIEPVFDISKLPPIESITATTDIRAFLGPGVPPELTRAALRRAWVADPSIRDFIGIAENQWDFNDPNGIPGFGSLGPLDDVRRLVAQVFGSAYEKPEESTAATEEISAPTPSGSESIAADPPNSTSTAGELPAPDDAQPAITAVVTEQGVKLAAAAQHAPVDEPPNSTTDVPGRRSHGGALPR